VEVEDLRPRTANSFSCSSGSSSRLRARPMLADSRVGGHVRSRQPANAAEPPVNGCHSAYPALARGGCASGSNFGVVQTAGVRLLSGPPAQRRYVSTDLLLALTDSGSSSPRDQRRGLVGPPQVHQSPKGSRRWAFPPRSPDRGRRCTHAAVPAQLVGGQSDPLNGRRARDSVLEARPHAMHHLRSEWAPLHCRMASKSASAPAPRKDCSLDTLLLGTARPT
jgi:hypothetical protein